MKKHHSENESKKTATPAAEEPAAATPAVEAAPAAEPAVSASAPADEIASLKDRLLRLQADFDNVRKRTARDRQELIVRANEDLLREILPVLDHFDMGMQSAQKHNIDTTVLEGFQLVRDQFSAALGRFGLVPVEAVGRPFDPNAHESIALSPSEQYPRDTVLVETRRGYRLGAQLLRPAQVVVSSGPGEAAQAKGEA